MMTERFVPFKNKEYKLSSTYLNVKCCLRTLKKSGNLRCNFPMQISDIKAKCSFLFTNNHFSCDKCQLIRLPETGCEIKIKRL